MAPSPALSTRTLRFLVAGLLLGLSAPAYAQMHDQRTQAPQVRVTLTATLVRSVTITVDDQDLVPGYMTTVMEDFDRKRVVEYSAIDDPNLLPVDDVHPWTMVADNGRPRGR